MKQLVARQIISLFVIAMTLPFCSASLQADIFTYVDESGKTVTLEASLYGSGKRRSEMMHGLLKPDGSIVLVPQGKIKKNASSGRHQNH